ncbi:hypothetical protein C5167_048542 [Papaver somniferum]|uniref:Phytocyanin domain-containing protein n=1 Tax=Papaver somniferum TaxID=3469 RepID=A0A4Y7KI96_PAPSO|nr:cucumber peeling cupredoxin-like [Papaver somniferum]RZC73063.1 hypothetical protein C5167_048542 [Papaver somniferum]
MKIINISSYLTIITLLVLTTIPSSESYTNHTVGGASGWYFNRSSNKSITDYSKWASGKTFNLGDYLIFDTNTNQTVIQTYNETAYKICNADDTDAATVYSGGAEIGKQVVLSVALIIEGDNYFFSSADDGAQCQKGMAFKIDVEHGVGLPPSLNQPPPPPFVDPPPSDQSTTPSDTTNPSPQAERFHKNGGQSGRIMGMQHMGVVPFCVLFGFLVLVL